LEDEHEGNKLFLIFDAHCHIPFTTTCSSNLICQPFQHLRVGIRYIDLHRPEVGRGILKLGCTWNGYDRNTELTGLVEEPSKRELCSSTIIFGTKRLNLVEDLLVRLQIFFGVAGKRGAPVVWRGFELCCKQIPSKRAKFDETKRVEKKFRFGKRYKQ
jgi:hypothetical protein